MSWLIAVLIIVFGLLGVAWCVLRIAAWADEDQEAMEPYAWTWEPDDPPHPPA